VKRLIEGVSDRLLRRVAPKTTAGAICSGWYTCCSGGKVGVRRKDPNYGNWCTPCYTTSENC